MDKLGGSIGIYTIRGMLSFFLWDFWNLVSFCINLPGVYLMGSSLGMDIQDHCCGMSFGNWKCGVKFGFNNSLMDSQMSDRF